MINPNTYYTVQGWMMSELGLKGNSLTVYAIIYGFTQDGTSEYTGSSKYLAEWLGCSKRTVLSILADLTEKGYLIKKTTHKNGVAFCNYAAVRAPESQAPEGGEKISPVVQNLHQGGEKISSEVVKKFHQGGEKISPHNIEDNNRDNYRDIDREGTPAAPAAPAPTREEKKAPVKHKYGEYQNVLLTDEEYSRLQALFPLDLSARIERLSEYIASKGTKYKSHYATIRSWANRDGKQHTARAAPGGGYPGTVGPNGIAIDPTKTDLDAVF